MEKLDNIKAIFIDIDGTLTNNNKQIVDETKEAIERVKEKGIYVVLCSGRATRYVMDKSEISNASNYVISCNGAQLYDFKKGQSIYESYVHFNLVENVWNYVCSKNIGCILNTQDIRYMNNNIKWKFDGDINIINDISQIEGKSILQIVIESKNYDDIIEAKRYIGKIQELNICNISINILDKVKDAEKYAFDVTMKNVNKGNTIIKFMHELDIQKEQSLCFGDHINDISMFDVCKNKVAMGNAQEKLKESADYVTLSNNENGVAYFLNKYI